MKLVWAWPRHEAKYTHSRVKLDNTNDKIQCVQLKSVLLTKP